MKFAPAVLGLSLLYSCTFTHTDQLRDTQTPIPAIELVQLEKRAELFDEKGTKLGCADPVLRKQSIEYFKNGQGGEFSVATIELSDDGHVKDDDQEAQVLADIDRVAGLNSGRGLVLVTFVHGWHHRPKVCDNNIACFRKVLYALSISEERPVYGVYIGWRGDSIKGKYPKTSFLSALSFYERKNTAHLIGHEGGRELLQKLNEHYKNLNDKYRSDAQPHPVTMVTVGHSFGGALVYSAVEATLVRELKRRELEQSGKVKLDTDHVVGRPAEDGQPLPIRPGIGDLVVLLNPAFEARRYEIFAEDLKKGKSHYRDDQLPVLLTAASEGDNAVGMAFPAGRTLYFLLHPWRYRGMEDVIGQGHYDPQTTHNLVLIDGNGDPILHPKAEDKVKTYDASPEDIKRCDLHPNDGDFSTCECEYPVPRSLAEALRSKMTFVSQGRGFVKTGPNERVSLQVREGVKWDEHSPFLVARVSAAIVPAHSDIYTPRFVTFLAGYIHEFLDEAKTHKPSSNVATASTSP
jgi:hypothetical protein